MSTSRRGFLGWLGSASLLGAVGAPSRLRADSGRRAASQIAKKESLEKDAARARAKTLLLPGAILQPNGIFAALRAQEAGCNYINAS